MKVLPKGTVVKHQGIAYVISRVHSVEPGAVSYEVTGNGPRQILWENELSYDEFDESIRLQELKEYHHYKLDFDTGEVTEHLAYGRVVRPNQERRDEMVVMYAPTYYGYLKTKNLEVVSKDYQLFLEQPDFDKAHIMISRAVYDRMTFFAEKHKIYDELIMKMAQ